jgi:hypothetical protein
MKKVRVVFSPEAEEVYNYLNEQAPISKIERTILNAVHKRIELIKANFHYGKPIAKNLIPREYKVKYGITNLFRVELPTFGECSTRLPLGKRELRLLPLCSISLITRNMIRNLATERNDPVRRCPLQLVLFKFWTA